MKRNRVSSEIQKITLSAFFVVLGIVFSRFSIYLPIAGQNLSRLGLGSVPIILGSLLLGPLYGAAIGGLSDLVGALAFPVGPYFFGFTLDSALLGVIPGLVALLAKRKQGAIFGLAFLSTLVAAACVFLFAPNDTIRIFDFDFRIDWIFITVILSIYLFLFMLAGLVFRLRRKSSPLLFAVVTSVFLDELLITTLLAGVWKTMLYSVPYLLSVSVSLVLLPLNLIVKSALIFLVYLAIVNSRNLTLERISLDQ